MPELSSVGLNKLWVASCIYLSGRKPQSVKVNHFEITELLPEFKRAFSRKDRKKKISLHLSEGLEREKEAAPHNVLTQDQSALEPVQTGVKIHREITISQLSSSHTLVGSFTLAINCVA